MTDDILSKYLPKFGDRLFTIQFCSKKELPTGGSENRSQEDGHTSKTSEIVKKLQMKLDMKRKRDIGNERGESSKCLNRGKSCDSAKRGVIGNKHAEKAERKIEIGWLMFDEAELTYKQVKSKKGGGTREQKVSKLWVKADIKARAKMLFFPNGKSKEYGLVELYEFDVTDFEENLLQDDITIGQHYELTSKKILRFYLTSRKQRSNDTLMSMKHDSIEEFTLPYKLHMVEVKDVRPAAVELKNDGRQASLKIIEVMESDSATVKKNEDKEGNSQPSVPDVMPKSVTKSLVAVSPPAAYKITEEQLQVEEALNNQLKAVQPIGKKEDMHDGIKPAEPATKGNHGPVLLSRLPEIAQNDIEIDKTNILGKGSFGTVYKGKWAATVVAIKEVLMPSRGPLSKKVFEEILVHAQMHHPYILQLMAVSRAKDCLLIITEYVNCHNIEKCIFDENVGASVGISDIKLQMKIATQLSEAIAYMHCQKPAIVHCDIKPANILFDIVTRNIKLCDMGLSKLKSHHTALTSACQGLAGGTPYYMAPECVLDGRNTSRSTDMWSVGITLTELFALRDAWQVDYDSDTDTFQQVKELMKDKKIPPTAATVIETNHPGGKALQGCVQYDQSSRLSAVDLASLLQLVCT